MKLSEIVKLEEAAQQIVGGRFKELQEIVAKHFRGAKLIKAFKQRVRAGEGSEVRGSGELRSDIEREEERKLQGAPSQRLKNDLEDVIFDRFARKTETVRSSAVIFHKGRFDFVVEIQPL